MKTCRFYPLLILAVSAGVIASNLPLLAGAEVQLPDGWQSVVPREEIRPTFSFEPTGGPEARWEYGDHAR